MQQRIKGYIAEVFSRAPASGKALELRDEMEQNLLEKYDDLIASGLTPEQAYDEVVRSVGDLSELFGEIERASAYERAAYGSQPQAANYAQGAANGAGQSSTQPSEPTQAPTAPPPFSSEQMAAAEELERKRRRKKAVESINGAMWMIIVALYFIISFTSGAWHITWVIFLIGSSISSLISLIGNPSHKGAINGAVWCLVLSAYFVASFYTGAWHITWVIFLFGAALSTLIGVLVKK